MSIHPRVVPHEPTRAELEHRAQQAADAHRRKVTAIASERNKRARGEKLKIHCICLLIGGCLLVLVHFFSIFDPINSIPGLPDTIPVYPGLVQEFFDWLYGL